MAPDFSGAIFFARAIQIVADKSRCGICAHCDGVPLERWHNGYNNAAQRSSQESSEARSGEDHLGGSMTDMVQATAPTAARVSDTYRWAQLAIGVAAMVMIANYQYGWTFFVPDIQKKFGWDRASIQWALPLFVLFENWLVPVEGWFVDKYGPRIVVLIGGILCAIGWAINAQATTLKGYYLGLILAGLR